MRSTDVVEVDAGLAPPAAPPPLEEAEVAGPATAPLVAAARPGALAAERYRLLALRIEAALGARATRAIVITSPASGDGKTTTALNLGAALAGDLLRRVVVVDADLARPRLARPLGLTVARGLGEVLRGEAALDEVTWRLGDDPLSIVPGTAPLAERGPGASALAALLPALRARHEVVLLSAPSLAESADAAALARAADGVLLVVRSGATRRDDLAAALDALCGAPILGIVLNDHQGSSAGYTRVPVLPPASPNRTEEE